jgi:hypothetical protein
MCPPGFLSVTDWRTYVSFEPCIENHACIFWIVCTRTLIFHISFCNEKSFQCVPTGLTLWPWPLCLWSWPLCLTYLTYFSKTLIWAWLSVEFLSLSGAFVFHKHVLFFFFTMLIHVYTRVMALYQQRNHEFCSRNLTFINHFTISSACLRYGLCSLHCLYLHCFVGSKDSFVCTMYSLHTRNHVPNDQSCRAGQAEFSPSLIQCLIHVLQRHHCNQTDFVFLVHFCPCNAG